MYFKRTLLRGGGGGGGVPSESCSRTEPQILTNLAEKKKFFEAKSPKKPVLKVQSLITSFDQGKATKSGHHSPSSRLLDGENEVRLILSGKCDRKLKLNSPKLNQSVMKHSYSKKKKFGASNCQKTKITT